MERGHFERKLSESSLCIYIFLLKLHDRLEFQSGQCRTPFFFMHNRKSANARLEKNVLFHHNPLSFKLLYL